MAALTYEPPRQDTVDSVFPGENWFFYWKSTASLWQEKILSQTGTGPLYIPINWAFHVEGVPCIDFGDKRADCDLQRIENICLEAGRRPHFLLPLGSLPFLVNGGVPSHLVKYPAVSEKGLIAACLDSENRLNQMTSFYDPNVFGQYQAFCERLAEYFDKCRMSAALIGVEAGYFENESFTSYFTDFSKGFELGFSRFLKVRGQENKIKDEQEERILRRSYQEEMFSLYETAAVECFSERWLGRVQVAFLGGGPVEVFKRSNDTRDYMNFGIKPYLQVRAEGIVPSTILLEAEKKNPLFLRFLQENVVQMNQHKYLEQANIDDYEDSAFQNLFLFEVLQSAETKHDWLNSGLFDYLNSTYSNLTTYTGSLDYSKNYDSALAKVFFVPGKQLTETDLRRVLKLFMASGKIVLDKHEMDPQVAKKLSTFFLENELQENHLYFISPVSHYSLDQGSVTIVDGQVLSTLPETKRQQFWQKLTTALDLNHQMIENYQDVVSTWMSRPAAGHELDYMEIRRLALYNPSSYRGKVKLSLRKDYKLLRVIDESGVKTSKNGSQMTFELSPGGAVKLDFGVFELE